MAIGIRSLPLNALRSFDAAARHLSFTAAAAELNVTAGAISVQIRRLEEWAGTPLFVRGHRSLSLTLAGERLAPKLTSMFLDLERLLTEITAIDAESIHVSTIQSVAAKLLAPRITSFTDAHPTLQVRIVGEDHRVDLERDAVDVAIRYGDGAYGELYSELIARAVAFPVCSPELARRYTKPGEIPHTLLFEDDSSFVAPGLPTWDTWFGAAGVARAIGVGGAVFRNSHMAIAAALAGQGFALGLSPLVDIDLAEGRLVRPFPQEVASPFGFWFVCRRERLSEPKIAAFRKWVFPLAAPGSGTRA
jgi:LysR family glycine cleavage system transcriptional activator